MSEQSIPENVTELPDFNGVPARVPGVYSNGVVARVSAVEMVLDFYHVGPSTVESDDGLYRAHQARLIAPLAVAKDMANVILRCIAEYEKEYGVTLPLIPVANKLESNAE